MLAILTTTILGCSDPEPVNLIGTWQPTNRNLHTRLSFDDKGRFILDAGSDGTSTGIMSGTYKQGPKGLVLHVTSYNFEAPDLEYTMSKKGEKKIEIRSHNGTFSGGVEMEMTGPPMEIGK